MANQSLLGAISSELNPMSWTARCIEALNSSSFDWTGGVVNGKGELMSGLTKASWGITYETCRSHCNGRQLPLEFDIQSLSSAMTGYLLPWIVLSSQLPFETGDYASNIISYCQAVGSPVLLGYSLMLTFLNRYRVMQVFQELRDRAKNDSFNKRYPEFGIIVDALECLLLEAQQVPLRLSEDGKALASLITIPENLNWWKKMKEQLCNTRRGITFPLVAAQGIAFVALCLTIWASFETSLGDPVAASQLAAGILWVWLIPAVLGWIFVGTQIKCHSVRDALQGQTLIALDHPRTRASHTQYTLLTDQEGFFVESDERSGCGVEQIRGAMFNYGRVFRFHQLFRTTQKALSNTMARISKGEACNAMAARNPFPADWDDSRSTHANMEGSAADALAYIGLQLEDFLTYAKWSGISDDVYFLMMSAFAGGMVLQWGTAGGSILLTYKTPSDGLGCRSGSYLIYGVVSTVVCILHLIANFLSHAALLRYQDTKCKEKDRTLGHRLICIAATFTRYAGNLFAVLNTIWLGVSSMMEFVGFYENCWCKANVAGLGTSGWVLLFKVPSELAAAAKLPWALSIALSVGTCVILGASYGLLRWRRDE